MAEEGRISGIRLNLNTQGDYLFNLWTVRSWASYATKRNSIISDDQMFIVLKSYYAEVDLATLLAASKDSVVGDVVKRLEKAQLTFWVGKKKKAEENFKILRLNSQGDNIFERPAFSTWVSYVTKWDKKDPENAMFLAFKKYYGDDDAVAKMLVAAKESDKTRTIASKLEESQLKNWQSNGISSDDAFALLKMDQDVDNVLTNPMLSTWVSYVEMLDEKPYVLLLLKLKAFDKTYDILAKRLTAAQKDDRTNAIAGKLEAELIDAWFQNKQQAGDVFKLLKLEKEGNYLLWDYLSTVRTWVAYVTKLHSNNPDELISSVLSSYMYYEDDILGNILTGGKMKHHAEKVTATIEEAVLRMWQKEKKSADDVFSIMLKDDSKYIFQTLGFST